MNKEEKQKVIKLEKLICDMNFECLNLDHYMHFHLPQCEYCQGFIFALMEKMTNE